MPVANPAGLAGARAGACLFLGEASQPQGCSAWAAALAEHAHFSTVVLADLISARPPSGAPGIMECVRGMASLPTLEMPLNITLARVDALENPFLLSIFSTSPSSSSPPPASAASPPPHARPPPSFTSPSAAASAAAAPTVAGGAEAGTGGECTRVCKAVEQVAAFPSRVNLDTLSCWEPSSRAEERCCAVYATVAHSSTTPAVATPRPSALAHQSSASRHVSTSRWSAGGHMSRRESSEREARDKRGYEPLALDAAPYSRLYSWA